MAGGPRYAKIEFCRDPKTLWGKIESRRWDWLGVHPDGKFVLGSPPVGGSRSHASATVTKAGAEEGQYGVGSKFPLIPSGGFTWYRTREEADEAFERRVEEERDESKGPALVRIRQVEGREVVREEFVVRNPSTYR